jgi:hypothetical protein
VDGEVAHEADAFDGEPGFEGAGFVVETGVEDAAVAGRLVESGFGFLFEEDEGESGPGFEKSPGGGEADETAADDGHGEGR